ncbi:MAG: PPC domain-containing protein [Labilithrix sp.]|nr:PPC domain-containing protein [Labilithrix sp.]MCW5810938.1 PPC domain-containing protein [Labilithrix sp.]
MIRTTALFATIAMSTILVACTVTTVSNDPGSAADSGAPLGENDAAASSSPDGGEDESTAPIGGCAFGEPNDDRDNATALTIGTAYTACTSSKDDDFYEFTTPDDKAGGLLEITFTNVKDGRIESTLFTAADNDKIGSEYETTKGADHRVYLGVAPNVKYRLMVTSWSTANDAFSYDFKVSYTKTSDEFEPNDTREEAKPITVGTSIEGTLTPKITLAGADKGWSDWFSVDLASGGTTIKLENVATNLSGEIELYNADGARIGSDYSSTKGANVTLSKAVSAGKHYVRVMPWSNIPHTGKGPAPDNFERRYKLTVTQ